MGDSANLSDAEFNTLLRRMLKKLSEDLSSIKNIQSETKGTLTLIKNNLQGDNSRLDEAENHIDDLEHKEAKTTNQNNKKKRIQKNKDSVSSLRDNFKQSQHSHHRGARKRRERARNGKCI